MRSCPEITRRYYGQLINEALKLMAGSPLGQSSPFFYAGGRKDIRTIFIVSDSPVVPIFDPATNRILDLIESGPVTVNSYREERYRSTLVITLLAHQLFLGPDLQPQEFAFEKVLVQLVSNVLGAAEVIYAYYRQDLPLPASEEAVRQRDRELGELAAAHGKRRLRQFLDWLLNSDIFRGYPPEVQEHFKATQKKLFGCGDSIANEVEG